MSLRVYILLQQLTNFPGKSVKNSTEILKSPKEAHIVYSYPKSKFLAGRKTAIVGYLYCVKFMNLNISYTDKVWCIGLKLSQVTQSHSIFLSEIFLHNDQGILMKECDFK